MRIAIAACAATSLTGCSTMGRDPQERKPGTAAGEVTVVRGDRMYPLTIRITDWQVRPHPQVPERGNAVHFGYRKTATSDLPEVNVEVGVCAVDAADIVLLCDVVGARQAEPRIEDGDSWIGPADLPRSLSDTARVVLLPDQLLPGLHAGDPKDGDGYVPPGLPLPGEELRTA
ncbi:MULTISPECIES: hypothetical protein [unclassified Streptomyces]|uniref:hypothetical protein n=1 Tax=unclassified Streptomyces TaxID=2593676 RepID=UPI002E34608D|nr:MULTISPECIES: hypothetical protein [unclassified Streptomyces]WUC68231.1 hypothetical protein OG861_30515 [Streptomyces sp. NBC_00539]